MDLAQCTRVSCSKTLQKREKGGPWGPVCLCIEAILRLGKDRAAVLNDELHGQVLRVHVRHLTLDAAIEHDGRSENDSQVLGRHLKGSVSSCLTRVRYDVLPSFRFDVEQHGPSGTSGIRGSPCASLAES